MKTLTLGLALVLLASISFARISTNPAHLVELWANWKAQYGKSYGTLEEEAYRFGVFTNNYNLIQNWNSEPQTSYMGVNKFADLTTEEFSSMYTRGYLANVENAAALTMDWENSELSWPKPHPKPLPTSWDWRTLGGVTNVKSQGSCGADYAFATAGALECTWFTLGNMLTSLSEQQFVDCDQHDHGCDGGDAMTALEYSEEEGNDELEEYPWKGSKGKCRYNKEDALNITSGAMFAKPNNSTEFMASIVFNPTIVIVEADQPVWQFYTSGVITANCSANVNHWVLAVGYGNYENISSYYIKNSWGTDWGVNGYVYIGQDNTTNPAGVCGILTQPTFPFPNIEPNPPPISF